MLNLYKQIMEVLGPGRVQIGKVTAYADGTATVQLVGAGEIRARGQASVGGNVYVQDGVIQGPAPDLPVYIEVI